MQLNRIEENEVLNEQIIIIWDNEKILSLYNNIEPDYKNGKMKGITLKDCLLYAKKNGYRRGTITVLSESYLGGSIYRYNNYGEKEWYEIGALAGFA